jgi:hypothetical protein
MNDVAFQIHIFRSTFRMSRTLLSVFAAALLAAEPLAADAALGETAASVRADAATLHSTAVARASSRHEFSVQRMTLPSTTVVDQYLSTDGTVFALRWRGPTPPDLSQLFGAYFPDYQALATQPHRRRARVHVDTGRMIYEAGGHMRDYWGLAYVPALMPAGVTEDDLQ